jgi:hypothetical protein
MSLPLPFRNFFHLGYVVLDLEQVMDGMRRRFGVAEWKILPLPEGAPAKAIGFAYVQDNMVELVELDLRQEMLPIHRGWLPATPREARLNHVAYMLDSQEELEALMARNEAAGIATAWVEPFGDIFSRYYYADTTAELGHYSEFVCLGPAGRDFLAEIPRN